MLRGDVVPTYGRYSSSTTSKYAIVIAVNLEICSAFFSQQNMYVLCHAKFSFLKIHSKIYTSTKCIIDARSVEF